MQKVKLGAGQTFEYGIDTLEVVLGPEHGAENIIVYRTVHAPGEVSEPEQHVHQVSEDVIAVLQGEGEIILGEDRERVPFEEGEVLFIPPGERHGTVNTGDEPLVRLTCHAPPDPNEEDLYGDPE